MLRFGIKTGRERIAPSLGLRIPFYSEIHRRSWMSQGKALYTYLPIYPA